MPACFGKQLQHNNARHDQPDANQAGRIYFLTENQPGDQRHQKRA